MSVSERTCPEASCSNHALDRATDLSNAGSTFRGRSSPSGMMIRVSTPRRFILNRTKLDRLKTLLAGNLDFECYRYTVFAQMDPVDEVGKASAVAFDLQLPREIRCRT